MAKKAKKAAKKAVKKVEVLKPPAPKPEVPKESTINMKRLEELHLLRRDASIIWNEILPNVRDAILVEGAMRWSWMLLGFSSLSFLGFGVSPPTPDWGLMISNARGLMSFAWWAVIAPIVGLSSLIIGINLTADAFAKALGIDRSTKAPV